nr:MAG TPA: hypothetical protein [Bacteriophage sp.]
MERQVAIRINNLLVELLRVSYSTYLLIEGLKV